MILTWHTTASLWGRIGQRARDEEGTLGRGRRRLNELFADEDLTAEQQETWLEGLIRTLLEDEQVREQAKHNTKGQFLASPTLRTKVLLVNQQAHPKMSDIIHQGGRPEKILVEITGEFVHHMVNDATRS